MSNDDILRQLEDARIDPPEPKAAKLCAVCGEGLYLGDHYYCIDGDLICEECVENLFGSYITDYDYVDDWEEG